MTEHRPLIRVMSADLALKIAAGEVVERPASVVKELIDNALDAGASTIRIEIREAGLKLVRVTDDGWGMSRDDLPLAFASHATSTLAVLDDLQHLTTLGFRGEALPSIAAVARVEVHSGVVGDGVGSRIDVSFGAIGEPAAVSSPTGTRVSVMDLFGNVPARRKFVRSLRAETGQISSVVTSYALAQPAVRFTLEIDGKRVFESPGTGSL